MKKYFTIANLVIFHWAMYWLMNGLDKFFNRVDFGIFTWYGKDRSNQFGGYFEKTSVPDAFLHPLLYLTGVIEVLIFIPLFMALWYIKKEGVLYKKYLESGFFWGTAVFVGFSFFDIIFGDRAELWEHGTFFIGSLLSYKLAKDEYTEINKYK